MKLIDITDRPFWRLSNEELNYVAFRLSASCGQEDGYETAQWIGMELEQEIFERNQL